jgi:hypothetical protein
MLSASDTIEANREAALLTCVETGVPYIMDQEDIDAIANGDKSILKRLPVIAGDTPVGWGRLQLDWDLEEAEVSGVNLGENRYEVDLIDEPIPAEMPADEFAKYIRVGYGYAIVDPFYDGVTAEIGVFKEHS